MSDVTETVGALAMSYIDRTLRSGKNVEIPSLEIVIKGDATVSTDAERREATDLWTIQLREQQLRELRQQLATVTAERDALAAKLLTLQVDRSRAVKLRDETDNVLWALKPADVPGAINWGDLGVREVQEVINDERCWWRVVIEEADPANPALHAAVLAGLVALGWNADDIEIQTTW